MLNWVVKKLTGSEEVDILEQDLMLKRALITLMIPDVVTLSETKTDGEIEAAFAVTASYAAVARDMRKHWLTLNSRHLHPEDTGRYRSLHLALIEALHARVACVVTLPAVPAGLQARHSQRMARVREELQRWGETLVGSVVDHRASYPVPDESSVTAAVGDYFDLDFRCRKKARAKVLIDELNETNVELTEYRYLKRKSAAA